MSNRISLESTKIMEDFLNDRIGFVFEDETAEDNYEQFLASLLSMSTNLMERLGYDNYHIEFGDGLKCTFTLNIVNYDDINE